MNPLVLLALWSVSAIEPPQPQPANVVRVCSLAVDPAATACRELDARLLEPAAPAAGAAGQVAYVDPETKSLVQPTRKQLAELAATVAIDEEMAKREGVTVETLPDGTLKLGPGASFMVYSKAVLQKKGEKP